MDGDDLVDNRFKSKDSKQKGLRDAFAKMGGEQGLDSFEEDEDNEQ